MLKLSLPYLALLLLFMSILIKYDLEWRDAFVKASIIWGITIVLLVEILSLFYKISPDYVFLIWCFICLALLTYILHMLYIKRKTIRFISNFAISVFLLKRDLLPVLVVIFILLITVIIAVVAPPNNWDSATYHMSRVMHWLQNASVRHYPTQTLHQLWLNNWAEYAILNFVTIGSGSDLMANTVQWFSFLGCAITGSLISKRFGGTVLVQSLTALIIVTTPTLILQSTSTQNDIVCAFWVAAAVLYCLRLVDNINLINSIYLGSALGLATATKATACIYLMPFVLVTIVYVLWQKKYSDVFKILVVMVGLVTILNVNHWYRNYLIWRNPLGNSEFIAKFRNEIFGPNVILSNMIRNVSLELGTPFQSVNGFMGNIVKRTNNLIGIGSQDPRTTFDYFQASKLSNHEDNAGNVLLTLAVVISVVWLMVFGYREEHGFNIKAYLACIVMGFVVFCSVLKFSIFAARLHLPLFVLSSVPVALVLSSNRKLAFFTITLFSVSAMPWLFVNQLRPLVWEPKRRWNNIFNTTRTEQYFANYPELYEPYKRLVEKLSTVKMNPAIVGLAMPNDSIEYPLWQLIRERGVKIKLLPVAVNNISNSLSKKNDVGEKINALIVLGFDHDWIPGSLDSAIGDKNTKYDFGNHVLLFIRNESFLSI